MTKDDIILKGIMGHLIIYHELFTHENMSNSAKMQRIASGEVI